MSLKRIEKSKIGIGVNQVQPPDPALDEKICELWRGAHDTGRFAYAKASKNGPRDFAMRDRGFFNPLNFPVYGQKATGQKAKCTNTPMIDRQRIIAKMCKNRRN